MMKTGLKLTSLLIVLLGILFTEGKTQNTNCNVSVQFTTVTTDAGFGPKHVLAVWVENSDGQFIRSIKVMADERKQYLYTWNDESAGNTVDAVTGATKTSHSAETVSWNGKDVNYTVVPDGNYKVYVEFTEEHAQGPLLIIPFTKSTLSTDSTLNNATNYTNISINYSVNNTNGIDESLLSNNIFSVFPNPITDQSMVKIISDRNTEALLSIYTLNGDCISIVENLKLNIGENFISLNKDGFNTKLETGVYLLRLEYDKEIKVIKLIKK